MCQHSDSSLHLLSPTKPQAYVLENLDNNKPATLSDLQNTKSYCLTFIQLDQGEIW